MVNEQMARRDGPRPWRSGDTGRGLGDAQSWAIYSDYGNPQAQAIIAGTEALAARYPDAARLRFAVRIHTDAFRRPSSKHLHERFDLPPQARCAISPSVKALSLRVFDQTFLVTGALNVLTLGVAGVRRADQPAHPVGACACRSSPRSGLWASAPRQIAMAELARTALLAH